MGLSLVEQAKKFVEGAPKVVKDNVSKADADTMRGFGEKLGVRYPWNKERREEKKKKKKVMFLIGVLRSLNDRELLDFSPVLYACEFIDLFMNEWIKK